MADLKLNTTVGGDANIFVEGSSYDTRDFNYGSSNVENYHAAAIFKYANNNIGLAYIAGYYPPPPPPIGGTNFGYMSGGQTPANTNTIDKFPFSSDTNASDVGDLTQSTKLAAGQSSSSHGYTSGGNPNTDTIDKFPFSSDTNASDVGNLPSARGYSSGQHSPSNGYISGGFTPSLITDVDKFPFSSDSNAVNVGDLTQARYNSRGHSSTISGYASGGQTPTIVATIDKFPFSEEGTATDVGDLSSAAAGTSTSSSDVNGYSAGHTPNYDRIDKFSFSSDANGADIASLALSQVVVDTGQSSTTNGYATGGYDIPLAARADYIQKYPFSSDSNAVDIGNLTQSRSSGAGQQY